MGVRQGAREYSAEERRRGAAVALEKGPAAASRELGIPKGTLSCWVYVARQAAGDAELTAPAGLREAGCSASAASGASQPGDSLKEAPAGRAGRRAEAGDQDAGRGPDAVCSPVADEGETEGVPKAKKSDRRVARVYTPSQRAEALERADEVGPVQASRELGISRFSIGEWRRKARLHAEGKLADSPVVGPDGDPAAERDRRILKEWKQHPGLGPSQVRNQLRRAGLKVSVHTVRKVMDEHGYVCPKVRRKEVHDQRYEAVRPDQLWHLDFLHRYIHKQKVYVLLLVDDFSRFIVGASMWDAERVAAVIETFEAAVARHGKPELAMSDGGSAFWAWRGVGKFTRLLEEYEVDQLIARVPQVNGKLEAFCS